MDASHFKQIVAVVTSHLANSMKKQTGNGLQFGSRIVVNPDGTLFVTTGDRGVKERAQDVFIPILRELRAFVSRKSGDGWTLAQEYVDKASGKTSDRPAF